MNQIVVAALYRFVNLPDYQVLRQPLLDFCIEQGIKGTLLLAHEGINGTVAGSRIAIDNLLAYLRRDERLSTIDSKESFDDVMPFYRMKVKLKKEIVTMGVENIDPNRVVGTYVQPKDWNELINKPDVTVVDTRNNYEHSIGSFKGALNPNTTTFREFPSYAAKQLDPKKNKKVAMFCTGGIRCEKSTAFLKEQGFEEVYHLQGGILKYLEEIPKEESLWEGECFVFDNRVAVDHDLRRGSYDQCYGCRHPITEEDKKADSYIAGVSCPYCYESLSEKQMQGFSERQKQIDLAKARDEVHIGLSQAQLRASRQQKKIKRDNEKK